MFYYYITYVFSFYSKHIISFSSLIIELIFRLLRYSWIMLKSPRLIFERTCVSVNIGINWIPSLIRTCRCPSPRKNQLKFIGFAFICALVWTIQFWHFETNIDFIYNINLSSSTLSQRIRSYNTFDLFIDSLLVSYLIDYYNMVVLPPHIAEEWLHLWYVSYHHSLV